MTATRVLDVTDWRRGCLVGVRWRHPDVSEDHVGPLAVDRLQQLGEVAARGDHLELRLEREKLQDSSPRDQVVIGDDDAHAHPPEIYSTTGISPARGTLTAMSLTRPMSVGGHLRVWQGADRRRSMVTARPVRYVAGVALIAIGYDVFAQGGEALLLTGPAGAFWPATGLWDRALSRRPALVAGRPARDLLSREWAQLPLGTAPRGIRRQHHAGAGGGDHPPVAGSWRAGMDRLAHVGAVLLAVGLGEAISATVAMVASEAGEVIDGSEMAVFMEPGWEASRGGLVVVPLALAWRRRVPSRARPRP